MRLAGASVDFAELQRRHRPGHASRRNSPIQSWRAPCITNPRPRQERSSPPRPLGADCFLSAAPVARERTVSVVPAMRRSLARFDFSAKRIPVCGRDVRHPGCTRRAGPRSASSSPRCSRPRARHRRRRRQDEAPVPRGPTPREVVPPIPRARIVFDRRAASGQSRAQEHPKARQTPSPHENGAGQAGKSAPHGIAQTSACLPQPPTTPHWRQIVCRVLPPVHPRGTGRPRHAAMHSSSLSNRLALPSQPP